MFMQSAAMALGFGSFFQYGKRKISSMSNEEFNVLTPEALTAQLLSNVNNMIPSVQQSFKHMEQMNVLILDAMANYFSQGVAKLEQWIQGRGENLVSNISGGVNDLSQGISDFFLPPASAAEYVPPDDLRKLSSDKITFGPTGPQQPTLDTLYARQSLNTLYRLWKFNPNTWNLIPKTQRVLIIKRLKNFKPKTVAQGIAQSTTKGSFTQKVATMLDNIKNALSRMKVNRNRPATLSKLSRVALALMKTYNQFVAVNRKPQLQLDTFKSLKAYTIIPK